MNNAEWGKKFKGLDTSSEKYIQLKKEYEIWVAEENKASAYRQKLLKGVLDLWLPVKNKSRSHFSKYNNQELIEIGKSLRVLNKLLQ